MQLEDTYPTIPLKLLFLSPISGAMLKLIEVCLPVSSKKLDI